MRLHQRLGNRQPQPGPPVRARRRRTRGTACDSPLLNARVVEKLVFDLLLRGLKVRLNELRGATTLVTESPNVGEVERELADLQTKRELILDNYTDGCYGHGPEAKAKRDAKLAPVLKRIEEIEKELTPAEHSKPNELEEALTNIRDLWEAWPTSVRRDILRTYVPERFQLRKDRTLRAEVCGVLLEVDIPVKPQPTKGMRYAGRQKAEKNQDGLQLEALQTVLDSTPLLGGVKVGAAGFEPTTPTTPKWCATKLRYAPTVFYVFPFGEGNVNLG